ncbi:MAG TPA: GntR family transcriptional regulator [Halanaerobiales bacterium]|nr:GntR family transcriptional regulator [Halanaerobiales bacterium]
MNKYEPAYVKVANHIREKITSKEYLPDSKLVNERKLCEIYDVSRSTIRKALDILEQEGYITRKQGRGTFVSSFKTVRELSGFLSITEDLQKQGKSVETDLVNFSKLHITEITKKIRDKLNSDEKYIYKIERLKYVNNNPFSFIISYLPETRCKVGHPNLLSGSLYKFFSEQCDITVDAVDQILEIVKCNSRISNYLEIEPEEPLFLLSGITYDTENKPIEYFKGYYRADTVYFHMYVNRLEEQGLTKKGIKI